METDANRQMQEHTHKKKVQCTHTRRIREEWPATAAAAGKFPVHTRTPDTETNAVAATYDALDDTTKHTITVSQSDTEQKRQNGPETPLRLLCPSPALPQRRQPEAFVCAAMGWKVPPHLLSRLLYPNPVCWLTSGDADTARFNVMTISWLTPTNNQVRPLPEVVGRAVTWFLPAWRGGMEQGGFVCSMNAKRYSAGLVTASKRFGACQLHTTPHTQTTATLPLDGIAGR